MFFNLKRWGTLGTALLLLSLGACKSSSDSGSDSPTEKNVSGIVSDPAIEGSTVTFWQDGKQISFYNSSNVFTSYAITNSAGKFSVKFKAEQSLSDVTMRAENGTDTKSGDSLNEITLSSPLEAFSSKNAVVVSPLTTLIVEEMSNSGASLEDARREVKNDLGLDATADITLDPGAAGNEELLKRSFIVTRIIKKMKDESSDIVTPFKKLSNELQATALFSGDTLNDAPLSSLVKDKEDLKETYETIKNVSEIDKMMVEIADRDLYKAIKDKYKVTGGSITNENKSKLKRLAKTIRKKLNQRVPETDRDDIVRLVVDNFGLKNGADYLNDDLITKIESNESDASIDNLNNQLDEFVKWNKSHPQYSITKYKVQIPLAPGELLGTATSDNAKRIAYYYNSNASKFYEAERLLDGIRDDQVNDDVYVTIAAGKADNGLFNDAKNVIERKLWTTQGQGDANRYIGSSFIDFNSTTEAKVHLAKSLQKYKKIIETAGRENFSADSSQNLQALSRVYNRINANAEVQDISDYALAITASFGGNTSKWARVASMFSGSIYRANSGLASSYIEQADEAVTAGDMVRARDLYNKAEKAIDQSQEIVKNIPEQTNPRTNKVSYKMRVFQLLNNMVFYGRAGKANKVLKAYNNDNGNDYTALQAYKDTKSETKWYSDTLGKALAMAGQITEAKDLAKKQFSSRFSSPIYMELASKLALGGLADTAWEIMNDDIEATTDRLENLTFKSLTSTKGTKYFLSRIAYSDSLSKTEKIAHLEKGLNLVEAYKTELLNGAGSSKNIYKYIVQYGYSNLANLYQIIGERAKAEELLTKALTVINNNITDNSYKFEGLKRLARVYGLLKNQTKINQLNQQAYPLVKSIYSDDEHLERADSYYDLLSDNFFLPKKDLILTIIDLQIRAAEKIYTGAEADPETAKKNQSRAFRGIARIYIRLGEYSKAQAILERAYTVALSLSNNGNKYNFEDKGTLQGRDGEIPYILRAFARAKALDRAKEIAQAIPFKQSRNYSLHLISKTYCYDDAFPNTTVASVDTDKDGKPDFFNPLATADQIKASGLSLDKDIDGDGVNDDKDKYPYDKSKN